MEPGDAPGFAFDKENRMKYIDSLREGTHVSEVYLCKSKQIAQTKTGKDYGNLVLQDKTGTIDSKIGIGNFEAMDYVYVDADVTMFQGNYQLNIRRIRKAGEEEYIPADYLPVSKKDVKVMYQELLSYARSIRNPYLSKLVGSFFVEDQEFAKAFCFHSAAKSVHHGFVGGLLDNFADNTDAKMETMIEALQSGAEGQEWLGYNRFFESNIRRSSR